MERCRELDPGLLTTVADRSLGCETGEPCLGVSVSVAVAIAVILAALSAPLVGWRVEERIPIRLHGAAGWGRPAVDGTTVFYLSRDHQLFAVDRRRGEARWRRPLGGGPGLTVGSQIVVDHDVVVAADGDLFAFDRRTGESRWRFGSADAVGVGRYLGDAASGIVYAGSQSGRLFAVDVRSGEQRWSSASLGHRVTVFAPVVNADRVAAGFTDFTNGDRGGGVVLFDTKTGAERWRVWFPARGRSTRPVFGGGVLFTGQTVVAAASDGTLYGLARTTGQVLWITTAGALSEIVESTSAGAADDHRAIAATAETLLVTSLAGTLVGVARGSRRERWRFQSLEDGSAGFGLSVSEGVAYVPFASGRTIAVDAASGQERWRVGGAHRRFEWPAAVVDGRVYLTSEDGLYVVDERAR